MTTFGAVTDENFTKMMIFLVQCYDLFSQLWMSLVKLNHRWFTVSKFLHAAPCVALPYVYLKSICVYDRLSIPSTEVAGGMWQLFNVKFWSFWFTFDGRQLVMKGISFWEEISTGFPELSLLHRDPCADIWKDLYLKISNIRHTKSRNLSDSRLV